MSEHTDHAASAAPATRADARRRAGNGADISRALDRHDRRIGWMDLLRGSSIILVILLHSTEIVTARVGDVPAFFEFLSNFFAPFRMPMLMFLSGLLVAGSLHAPVGKYVWGKVRRIVWPIVVWTFIYAAGQYLVGKGEFMPWQWGFWNTYLWFMQFIFAYYILALLMKWVPIWVLFGVPFVLMFVVPDGDQFALLQRFFYLMPFFFLGAFIEKHWDQFARLLSVRWAAVLSVIPLGLGLFSGLVDPLWYVPLSVVPALLGIMILVRLTAVAPDVSWLAPVRFVGQYSLIYYVSHYPVFAALGWLAVKAGITNSSAALIVVFIVTMGVATVFALLGRRMPVSLLFELPRRMWPAKKATVA